MLWLATPLFVSYSSCLSETLSQRGDSDMPLITSNLNFPTLFSCIALLHRYGDQRLPKYTRTSSLRKEQLTTRRQVVLTGSTRSLFLLMHMSKFAAPSSAGLLYFCSNVLVALSFSYESDGCVVGAVLGV